MSDNDPIVTLPPLDRHGSQQIMTHGMSWENEPDSLLQKFIDLTFGSDTQKVGILDTGGDSKHPYLKNCKLGDMKDFTRSRTGPNDFNKHGTFVWHQIFRRCPNAEFFIAKVLGDQGSGTSSGIKAGLDWLNEKGCTFVNASLGASSRYDPMGESLREMQRRDCLACIASGNSGRQFTSWPAGWGVGFNVLVMGAFNSQKKRSRFTDYGSHLMGLGAGENIIAASAQTQGQTRMSGTSMGSPNACALYAGYRTARAAAGHSNETSQETLFALSESMAEDIEREGKDITTGYGVLTLKRTVSAIEKLEKKPEFDD